MTDMALFFWLLHIEAWLVFQTMKHGRLASLVADLERRKHTECENAECWCHVRPEADR